MKKVKVKKEPPFKWVNVRFLRNPAKTYTYKVRKAAKIHLGQYLFSHGDAVAVVGFEPPPCSFIPPNGWTWITKKVVPL